MSVRSLTVSRGLWLVASIACGLMLAGALLLGLPAVKGLADTTTTHSAHVVVQFADGSTAVRPISWTGTITRIGALLSSGFAVEHTGDLVCSIEGEGCPVSNCWCPDNRWAQGQWQHTAWDTAAWPPPPVADGDVIAFRNGSQADYSDWGLAGLLAPARTFVAASDALEWMRAQQQSDGSYDDGFSKVGASVRALISLGSARHDPAEWGSPSLLDYFTTVNPICRCGGQTRDWGGLDRSDSDRLCRRQPAHQYHRLLRPSNGQVWQWQRRYCLGDAWPVCGRRRYSHTDRGLPQERAERGWGLGLE